MRLYPFQDDGVDFLKSRSRAMLADEPGLGKTVQALRACEAINARRVLIVCPNSIKNVWVREIEQWTASSYSLIDGSASKRKKLLTADAVYTIINYEALRCHAVSKPKSAQLEPELCQEWDVLILDEAHRVANRKAQISKVVKAVAKNATCVYELTGTPVLNKASDLWILLNLLDSKQFSSYWQFAKKYCEIVFNGYGYQVLDIPDQNDARVRRLRHDLAPFMLRRLKKDVFSQMPAKTIQQVWIDLQGRQLTAYREMEIKMLSQLVSGEKVYAPVVIAQITRLKQIAIDPYLMLNSDHPITGAKIDAVKDILSSCEGKKIVIFSQFVKALNRLADLLTSLNLSYATLTGEITGPARQQEIDRFQNDPNCPVFLCSTKAGGIGLTLTAASIAIFLDKLWTPALNTQASDRLHRIGQTEPVMIYEVLAKDTVEEDIEMLLSRKQNVSDHAIELLGKIRNRVMP